MKKFEYETYTEWVSVPLRGSWFWSSGRSHIVCSSAVMRFRPLTGKLVLINVLAKYLRRLCAWFPSPYGEVGFDHYTFEVGYTRHYGSFRPLTGKLVLIREGNRKKEQQPNMFPSPYGEVGFDQDKKWKKKTHSKVSVPLRGSWFWSANCQTKCNTFEK